ncbi:LuxR C-terminal-related transcriptional regulator [Lentzea chajnantorensis]
MLQVAAVLGSRFTPQDLAEMLGERPAQLLGPLQEALAAGLIGSEADEFVFHREPVWRAVLGTVPELLRSMLHHQAATMLLARPRARAEAAAVHLVHCTVPGDTAAIATIREAAHRMLASSPQAASALATRGLRIATPGSADHAALATTATAALVRLGCLSEAVDLAREQLGEHLHGGPEFTRPLRTWLATALLLRGDTTAAYDLSNQAVSVTRPGTDLRDPATEPCPELLLLNALSHNDQSKVTLVADRVLDLPEPHSDDVRAAALNVRAMSHWREGRLDEAISAVDEAVRLRGPLTRAWQSDPLWTRAWLLTRVRKLDEALAAAETARAAIDAEHNGVLSPVPLALRATILLAKGELAAAEADARAGLAASERAEMPLYQPQLRAVLVISALRRGDLAMASDSLRRLEERAPAERAQPWTALIRVLAAVVTSARRGAHAAMDELRGAITDTEQCRQILLEDPSMTAWAVRTALSAGERQLAGNVVTAAERIAAENPGFDTVLAAARHGRALYDNDVSALAGLEDGYGDPWAAASVIEDTGTLLREQDRDRAIAGLNRAMAAYDELGAEWDSARVRRKLRRLGVRRRHWNHEARPETGWDSLTSTEAKVARLVAQGLTNRQVASEMFVSPHTVGFHLRQIYRKLSIQSRVDLARIAP